MSQGEFTVMRAMDLYYQYLNAGFRLPIGAGTDKMGEGIPVGSNRLCAVHSCSRLRRLAGGSEGREWLRDEWSYVDL